MASINWGSGVITVPKTDLDLVQSVPTEIYNLDLNFFRRNLKDLEDDMEGMSFSDTHAHNDEVILSGLTYARVIEILDPYTVTFENGTYAVNLIGANSNVADKTNVNFVSVRPQNSAGLITTIAIENGEFGGRITIDPDSPNSGTVYPTGTQRKAVNNVQDAVAIAHFRGFDELFFQRSMSIGLGDDITNFKVTGRHPIQVIIDFMPDALTNGVTVKNCTLMGTLDGDTILDQCLITDLDYVNGFLVECTLGAGTIKLGGNNKASFNRCISDVAGNATPIIDLGGSGQSLIMRNYSGGIKWINRTGNDPVSMDLASGQVKLDSTFQGGDDVRIAGSGRIKNEGSNVNYDDSGLISGTVTIGSQGFVVVDLASTFTGTTYPVGTIPYPVNNIDDAIALAQKNSVSTFKGVGLLTITNPYTINNARFIGVSINQSSVEFGSNLTFDYLTCEDMHISGTCTGSLDTHRCEHHNLQNYVGNAWSGSFLGGFDYALAAGQTILYEPVFIGNETSPVVFDLSATDIIFAIERGSGGIKITNLGSDDTLYLHMMSGSVELDATCTGTIKLFGSAILYNNTITAAVLDYTINNEIKDISSILGLTRGDPVTIGNGKYLASDLDIDVTDNGNGTYTLSRI